MATNDYTGLTIIVHGAIIPTPVPEQAKPKSKAEQYFERIHAFELAAWATHPEPVTLLEAAYERALEAIEAHDWGQYPENLDMTRENFITKFESYHGLKAYTYCLSTRDTYERS